MPAKIDMTRISAYRLCVRCGIRYQPRRKRIGLCTDCRYVVPEEERDLWVSP